MLFKSATAILALAASLVAAVPMESTASAPVSLNKRS